MCLMRCTDNSFFLLNSDSNVFKVTRTSPLHVICFNVDWWTCKWRYKLNTVAAKTFMQEWLSVRKSEELLQYELKIDLSLQHLKVTFLAKKDLDRHLSRSRGLSLKYCNNCYRIPCKTVQETLLFREMWVTKSLLEIPCMRTETDNLHIEVNKKKNKIPSFDITKCIIGPWK